MPSSDNTASLPAAEELFGYFEKLSNWGRWGEDDRLGTLNLITPKTRAAAAALVTEGIVVSLARDMDPAFPDPLDRGTVLQRFMQVHDASEISGDGPPVRFGGVREYTALIAHGSNTHLDGLAHISWDGKNYNGFPAGATTSTGGATKLSVHHAREGIITRGILLDIPALLGTEWLPPEYQVSPAELDAAAARKGVEVREGDVVLLYTGNFKRIAAEGLHPEHHHPGYGAGCLPWLHEHGVALISSDNINDANPTGYDGRNLMLPVHCVGLVAMGLWLVDNMILDELAATCARLNRWEFMFSMLPWRFVGVTASPVNPVALF
jgi:kynurenine formamidase